MNTKILFAIPFVVILILSGCKTAPEQNNTEEPDQLLGESCGTVSPEDRDSCCAAKMQAVPRIQCVGEWRYKQDSDSCDFECTEQMINSFEECAAAGNPIMESHPRQCIFEGQTYVEILSDSESSPDQLIGGQRDEHGCLGPAGYSWNEEIGACARQWELDESQVQAAKTAVAKIGQADGLTVVEVLTLKCPGCFDVKFDTYQEFTVVQIRDGKAE